MNDLNFSNDTISSVGKSNGDVSFLDSLGAEIRSENPLFKNTLEYDDTKIEDVDYSKAKYIDTAPNLYYRAYNNMDIQRVNKYVEEYNRNKSVLNDTSIPAGLLASVVSEVLNPINYLALINPIAMGSVISSRILYGVGEALFTSALSELALHDNNPLRTGKESFYNVAFNVALSGALPTLSIPYNSLLNKGHKILNEKNKGADIVEDKDTMFGNDFANDDFIKGK